ncbi:MAG: SLBB domain-containing protein [Sporomusaceae bacterium]|nr:SLBB domain-containing protein [Sporomusaceae bacterium]
MREEIVAAVRQAGVVGAGGAGFPTHVKINAAAAVVIANGAECEPLLRANQHLLAVESRRLVLGMNAVMLATGASRGYIGVKRKYEAGVAALQAELAAHAGSLELFFLPDMYPAGDEHVLVYEVTGRIVPEGGIPLQVGAIVANVETLVNIARSLEGTPVTEKYVTVTGAVRSPATYIVPVGMKVADLVALAGGASVAGPAFIDGGPMMGRVIDDQAVVTKTTGGIIVLPREHSLITQKNAAWTVVSNRAKAVCCNCMACTEVCPRHLLGHRLQPHRIMQAIGRGQMNEASLFATAFLCSECGACETFGCTMGLSPRRVNAEIKKQLAGAGIKNNCKLAPQAVSARRENSRIPTKRLLARLGLSQYDAKAPLVLTPAVVKEVRIPLSQHIGAPARPVVTAGQAVNKGDLIAVIPEGAALGANVHASIDGQVFAVGQTIGIRTV